MKTMKSSYSRAFLCGCMAWVAMAALATPAIANIDLFFQPVDIFSAGPTCTAGQILTVQLRARSSTAAPEQYTGLSVILEWDPTKLEFMEHIPNVGPEYVWAFEFYPAGGINPNYADGDASYYAGGQFATPPDAPDNSTNGMLVTTFKFKVLAPTDASTLVMVATRAGELTQTSDINANDTTGDISSVATFTVANACDCLLGDVDLDLAYTFLDIDAAVNVLLGLDVDLAHINAVDADCDGDADGDDIQKFTDFMLLAL
ncbi:MAG: hypothetical protein AABZ08_04160 [Planctomycetota bacterium]